MKGEPRKYIHGHNIKSKSGQLYRVKHLGYWIIKFPGHHRACPNGYVKEHILIAEKALGNPCPQEPKSIISMGLKMITAGGILLFARIRLTIDSWSNAWKPLRLVAMLIGENVSIANNMILQIIYMFLIMAATVQYGIGVVMLQKGKLIFSIETI